MSLFLYWWTWQLNGTDHVFSPHRGCITFAKCTPSRTSSPRATQGTLRLCCPLPWHCPSSSQRITRSWVLKGQTLCSVVYKKLALLKPSPFSPIIGFGEQFIGQSPECVVTFYPAAIWGGGECFLVQTWCNVLSPPLSFSSLWKCLPLLSGTEALLSPKLSLCTMYLPCYLPQITQIVLLILRSIS